MVKNVQTKELPTQNGWILPVVQSSQLRKLVAYFTALAMLFCAGRITEKEFVEYAKEFVQAL